MFLSFRDNTEDMTIISLNEKLEPSYLKPKLPKETFVSMITNLQGDLFILTAKNDRTLIARRYEHGDTEPSGSLSLTCDSLAGLDLFKGFNCITPSEENRNVIFLAIAHPNHDDDRELFVGKFDFSTHTTKTAVEVFTGKYIRSIEKNYTASSKFGGNPDIGGQKKNLTVKLIKEHKGKLVTVLAESFFSTLYNITTYYERAFIINCYDSELQKQFQQLMPIYRESPVELTSGFEVDENKMEVISNITEPQASPIYGQLDLQTGKWLKLEKLNTEHGYNSDEHIIWFDDIFLVPYLKQPGMFGNKYNIDLQSYSE